MMTRMSPYLFGNAYQRRHIMNGEVPMSTEPLNRKSFPFQSLFIRRQGLVLLGALAVGVGLYLNWGWLVATGIAPVLVAVSPCLAMCALGVCHRLWSGGSGIGSVHHTLEHRYRYVCREYVTEFHVE